MRQIHSILHDREGWGNQFYCTWRGKVRTNPLIFLSLPGQYWVRASDICCIWCALCGWVIRHQGELRTVPLSQKYIKISSSVVLLENISIIELLWNLEGASAVLQPSHLPNFIAILDLIYYDWDSCETDAKPPLLIVTQFTALLSPDTADAVWLCCDCVFLQHVAALCMKYYQNESYWFHMQFCFVENITISTVPSISFGQLNYCVLSLSLKMTIWIINPKGIEMQVGNALSWCYHA